MTAIQRVLLCIAAAIPASAPCSDMRYIFFNKTDGIEWHTAHPDSITSESLVRMGEELALPANDGLAWGVAYVFDLLRHSPEQLESALDRVLAACLETGVPVFLQFDGVNWWEHRPDLWNWWDPDQPGYNPDNAANVEWTDWTPDAAVKIGWRNWGSQIRVLPAPNLASDAVRNAHREVLNRLLPKVTAWRESLPPDQTHLFGGVKLGHETSIGVNAYYYPGGNRYLDQYPDDPSQDPTHGWDPEKGWTGGLSALGYAAVKTAGIKSDGELTREDIARVVQDYLKFLSQIAHQHGLSRAEVFTHQGGTYSPWDAHLPFWPAFNEFATPGYSFYGVDPHGVAPLGQELDRRGSAWAAVEWWWGAPDAAAWRRHFERTLGFRDCRLICVYNWNCGFRFRNEAEGIRALREMFREYSPKRP